MLLLPRWLPEDGAHRRSDRKILAEILCCASSLGIAATGSPLLESRPDVCGIGEAAIWGEEGRGDGDYGREQDLGSRRGGAAGIATSVQGDCCDVGGGLVKPWWTPSLRPYRVVVDIPD
jgi:hypothetical protein